MNHDSFHPVFVIATWIKQNTTRERGFNMRCHQRGSNVGSAERKWRQEACALRFLSEGLIVVCQRGQWSLSWLILSLFYSYSLPVFLHKPFPPSHSVISYSYLFLQAIRTWGLHRESAGRESWLQIEGCIYREVLPAYQTSQFTQSGVVVGGGGLGWSYIHKHWDNLSPMIELGLSMPV